MNLSRILGGVAKTLQIACVLLSFNVCAQTFYVDSVNGNDAWSGNFPDPQTSDGPWRTLSKVNNSIFLPGDSVLFKCGGLWREQLDIPSSGTASAPILYGAYGVCDAANRPTLSGADILSHWNVYAASTYVTSSIVNKHSGNLIADGTFDRSPTIWGSYLAEPHLSYDCGGYGSCLSFVATGAGGLVASSRFALVDGNNYRISFRMRAEADTSTTVTVRMATSPYDAVGFSKTVAASTSWNNYSYDFVASRTLDNAKVDFYGKAGNAIVIDDVRLIPLTPEPDVVNQLYVNGSFVRLAQYPNPRTDQTDTYHSIAPTAVGAEDNPGCPGSGAGVTSFRAKPYPVADGQNIDPSNQDMVGAGVHIRTNDWLIDDRVIGAYSSLERIFTIGAASSYGLCKDWGFYLDNKLWMLDAPGEWFFDATTYNTYIWVPSGVAPGDQVEASHREFGIDARYKSYLIIDGLRVEKAGIGIDLSSSTGVEVRNSEIRDSAGSSINSKGSGIVASAASFPSIVNNSVLNSTRDGIVIKSATNGVVRGNFLLNSGYVGSPKKSVAAIQAGGANSSLIENNHSLNSGYVGIVAGINDRVSGNLIENSCLILDDCGAIYTNSKTNGLVPLNVEITGNVIRDALGNVNGKPSGRASSAHGIYLDDSSHAVTVQGNTVINADNGIQLHNGHDNFLAQNTVYGVRKVPAAVSEDALAGQITVRGNKFESNLFFPTLSSSTYRLISTYDNNDFGTYDLNHYSSLYGINLVNESYKPGGISVNNTFTLPTWQQTRGHDVSSTVFDLFGIAHLRVVSDVGANFVSNSLFDSGVIGWGAYQGIPGSPQWTLGCVDGGCLRFERNATTADGGHVNTRLTGIQAGKTYLVRFDLKGGHEGQSVRVDLYRADAPYTYAGWGQNLTVGTTWQSYALLAAPQEAFALTSLLFHVAATESIYLDNVVVREVTTEANNVADDSVILLNTDSVPEDKDCPDATSNPEKCDQYVRFVDGSPVQWPVTVPAMGSEIVVWSQNPMRDSDRDGIVDSEDVCPGTPISSPQADDRGCSFIQNHSADLSISLTASPASVVMGDAVNYTVTVTNAGRLSATHVTINGSLPSCSLGTISNGGSASCSRSATANSVGSFTQTISVTATEPDTNTTNNTATVNTNVQGILNVSKSGGGVGSVTSNPSGILCGADCSQPYDANTSVVLSATPSANSVFTGWSGCDAANGTSCTVAMNTSKTVTANFTGSPDLVMSSIAATQTGSSLLISDRVSNAGGTASGAFDIGFYLSANKTYGPTDSLLCSRSVASLPAGVSSPTSGVTRAGCAIPGVAAGNYYVIARADSGDSVGEMNEANNSTVSARFAIAGIDLVPTGLTVYKGDQNRVVVSDTVKNQGNLAGGTFAVHYYLSIDPTYESTDIALTRDPSNGAACSRTITAIGARASNSGSPLICYAPSAASGGAAYYVLAVVDAGNAVVEYNESNNFYVTPGTLQ